MYANKSKEEMRARLEEFKKRKQQSKEISKSNLLKDVTTTTNKLTTMNPTKAVKINLKTLPSSKLVSLTTAKENINKQSGSENNSKTNTKKFVSVKSRLFKPTVSSSLKSKTDKTSSPSKLESINNRIQKLKTPQKENKSSEKNKELTTITPQTPKLQQQQTQLSPLSAIKNKIQKLKTPQKNNKNDNNNTENSVIFTPSKINGVSLNEALQRSLKKKRESTMDNQVCLSDELVRISNLIKNNDILKGQMDLGILEKDNWDKIRQMALYWQIKIQILEKSSNSDEKMKINDIYFDALATMTPDTIDYDIIEKDYDRYLTEEIHKEEQNIMLTELEQNHKQEKEQEEKEEKEEEELKKKNFEESKTIEKSVEIETQTIETQINEDDKEIEKNTEESSQGNEIEMNVDMNDISVIEETDDKVETNVSFSDNSNSPNQKEIEITKNNENEESDDDDDDDNITNNGMNTTASSLFDPDETLGFDDEEMPINNQKLTNKIMKITNFMTPTKGRDSFSYDDNYGSESINSSQKPTKMFNSSELSPINSPSYNSMKGSVIMIDEIPLSKRKRELLVEDIASTIFSPVRRSVRLNHSPVPVSPHLFDNSKIKYLPNPALDPLMDNYPPNKRQKMSLLTPHK